MVPDFAIMLIVDVPALADAEAASVKVATLPEAPGPSEGVTPFGKPEIVTETEPVKPFCGVTVRLADPLAPCAMVNAEGAALKVKVAGEVTVSATVVLAVTDPDAPVTVTVDAPGAAELAAVSVNVLLPETTGPNDAVTPDGKPDAESATVPLNPF